MMIYLSYKQCLQNLCNEKKIYFRNYTRKVIKMYKCSYIIFHNSFPKIDSQKADNVNFSFLETIFSVVMKLNEYNS